MHAPEPEGAFRDVRPARKPTTGVSASGVAARRALLVAGLLAWVAAAGGAEPGEGTPGCDAATGCPTGVTDAPEEIWVDASYAYVTTRADALAQWLDSFFGTATSDFESADSVLRLRTEYEWDEEEDTDFKVRVRGKVDLPLLDRRLSLVFADGDDPREDVIPNAEDTHEEDLGLRYSVAERDRSRLWLTVGTNASLDFKSSLRYKYVHPISRDWRAQFTERLYYREDEGFGTLTRGDLDYSISDNRIVRWTNQFEYGEETDGVEWATRLNYQLRLSRKHALSYFAAVVGDTDPDYLSESYALGVQYRRNLLRPWIFFEVEPAHAWRRESEEQSRSSVWILTFRIEFLEELQNRRARRAPDRAAEPAVD
jgi:hypothetical protein